MPIAPPVRTTTRPCSVLSREGSSWTRAMLKKCSSEEFRTGTSNKIFYPSYTYTYPGRISPTCCLSISSGRRLISTYVRTVLWIISLAYYSLHSMILVYDMIPVMREYSERSIDIDPTDRREEEEVTTIILTLASSIIKTINY